MHLCMCASHKVAVSFMSVSTLNNSCFIYISHAEGIPFANNEYRRLVHTRKQSNMALKYSYQGSHQMIADIN